MTTAHPSAIPRPLGASVGHSLSSPPGGREANLNPRPAPTDAHCTTRWGIELFHLHAGEALGARQASELLAAADWIHRADGHVAWTTVLIDDVHPVGRGGIDRDRIHAFCANQGVAADFLIHETALIDPALRLIGQIPALAVTFETIRHSGARVAMVGAGDGRRMAAAREVDGRLVPTCAALAAAWIIVKLGIDTAAAEVFAGGDRSWAPCDRAMSFLDDTWRDAEAKADILLAAAGLGWAAARTTRIWTQTAAD